MYNIPIVNCRSICKKITELLSVINDHIPHIVLGTESWLMPDVSGNEILNLNFNTYCNDSCVYSDKNTIISMEIITTDWECEVTWTKITIKINQIQSLFIFIDSLLLQLL